VNDQDKDLGYPFPIEYIKKDYLEIVDKILLAASGRLWELARDTAPHERLTSHIAWKPEEMRKSRLGKKLLLLADYAGGWYVDTEEVEQAMKEVYRILFGDCLTDGYTVPQQFFKTELGKLFNDAYAKLFEPEDLMTPAQVYRELGVARQSVYDMMSEGKLHPVYINGQTRFVRSEIDSWKQQRKQRKASE
jgi:predicted DNA-binding transcriptional regulator AlpA